MRPLVGVVLAALLAALVVPATGSAARLVPVRSGFSFLTEVTAPESGEPTGTLYFVERRGVVKKLRGGRVTTFLNIADLVRDGGEQGLFSLEFDPSWGTNRHVYVHYTNNAGNTRVVRYTARANLARVRERTRRPLLRVNQPASNHNGGQLAFGPGGRLYVSLGDGGGGCDPGERAQNLGSRLGKLLSVDRAALRAGWRIDAYGLRNMWRFSFDRKTNRFYGADVGQDDLEEINSRGRRGLGGQPDNYGWDVWEGNEPSECANGGLRGPSGHVRPVATYGRAGGNCSVTGGFAYRGASPARWRGWYFFGDFCSGRIWRLLLENGRLARGPRLVLDTPHNITSFGEGVRGGLHVATSSGRVFKLVRS